MCNLNQGKNCEDFMNGLQNSDSIQKLGLSDNELSDENGLYVIKMIKFQAEKRDRTQWLEGLRQPKPEDNLFDQLKFKDVNFKSIDHKHNIVSPPRRRNSKNF